jgi:hypothetical protein
MAAHNLEKRVTMLEQEVSRLRFLLERQKKSKPWWEQIAGTFANDPLYDEAMRLGREYRESTRPKTKKVKKKRSPNGNY